MKRALVLAAVVLAALVIPQLMHGAPRVSGFNGIEPGVFSVTTNGQTRLCQRSETLFAGTRDVRLTIGTYHAPGPRIDMAWTKDGRTVARGTLPAGWREGVIRVPLSAAPRTDVPGATVCFSTRGRLAWAGRTLPERDGATVNGRPGTGQLSLVSERGSRSLW